MDSPNTQRDIDIDALLASIPTYKIEGDPSVNARVLDIRGRLSNSKLMQQIQATTFAGNISALQAIKEEQDAAVAGRIEAA